MNNHIFISIILSIAGGSIALPAIAQERPAQDLSSGFYAGLSMRERGSEADGIQFGHLTSAWNKYALPTADDGGARVLAFGGYRWRNDLAVEAALGTTERFQLHPEDSAVRRGMGLALNGSNDPAAKAWNVDVYTSWGFAKSLALYGRLGYVQSDPVSLYGTSAIAAESRRNRDGVNYGVGLRYDLNRSLGLRLEYARYGRMPGETVNGVLPESDQVQFGLQFRF
jgi:opacity protein-like surface antigen